MRPHIGAIGLLLLCLIGYLSLQSPSQSVRVTSPAAKLRPKAIDASGISNQKSTTPEVNASNCAQEDPLFSAEKEKVAQERKQSREPDFSAAYSHPERLLNQKAMSAEAGIAVFTMIASCYPHLLRPGLPVKIISEGCPKIDSSKLNDPLQMIESVAELDSIEAKLFYLENIPSIAHYLARRGDLSSTQMATQLLSKAERYGVEAARSGDVNALRELSYAFEFGEFGPPDLRKAYTFALPLAHLGSESDRQRLRRMQGNLTAADHQAAVIAAYGCSKKAENLSLKSPFL